MSGAGSESAREQVAAASRRLAAEGLVRGTSGNVSARAGDGLVAVTPTGGVLGELRAEQIPVVGMDGAVVEGELAPTSEVFLHLGVYERYGAGAVVHTHAPVATAVGTVLDELPCVHYELLALGGTVRVAPYRTFGTPELAEAVLEALDGRVAALMANHGAITYGDDMAQAVERALLLEWACTVYWRAAAIGEPRVLGPDALGAVGAAVAERGYGSTRPR
ncbi:MAG: L-fuculose-phosphate aldolase [Solirubrobacteraceae bacterium]|jgi:L-fuculose-phosphate aldolase|nr:L-fuculose-phosphate aldolase [Solirubrobacteraceae bacterium]